MTDTPTEATAPRRKATRNVLIALIVILLLMLCGIVYVLQSILRSPERTKVLAQQPGVQVAFEAFQGTFGALDHPTAVAFDGNDRIYVTQPTSRLVAVFDRNGKNGRVFVKDPGAANDTRTVTQHALLFPTGIDVGPDGTVYVADPQKAAVVVFDANGTKLREIPFQHPYAVTVHGQRLYVVTDSTLYITDLQGNRLAKWGTRGQGVDQLSDPQSIAVDSKQNIYLTDMNNYRLLALSPDFAHLWQVGAAAKTDAEANSRVLGAPSGLTFGGDGNLYMVDGLNDDIIVVNPTTGKIVSAPLGSQGSADNQFYLPKGIDYISGNTFVVADTFKNRIVGLHLTLQPVK
jgi:DNA-binding beta-propeller fold protein YncE